MRRRSSPRMAHTPSSAWPSTARCSPLTIGRSPKPDNNRSFASDREVDLPAVVMAPLQFELTRRALLEVTLVGLACGALGVLVVLRGLSFISDALGHCVVPGVVVAYLLHGPLELWGGVAALLSACGMALLARHARLGGDTAIAVVFTTLFALGLGLISASGSYLTDLTEILFGNVLSVD